jgi:hypothetical protein
MGCCRPLSGPSILRRTFLTTQPTQNLRPRTQLTNRVVLQGFLCKCNTGVDSMAGCPTLLIYACNGMQPSRDLRRLPSCPGHRQDCPTQASIWVSPVAFEVGKLHDALSSQARVAIPTLRSVPFEHPAVRSNSLDASRDWDTLLSAVEVRLAQSVGQLLDVGPVRRGQRSNPRRRASAIAKLLQCRT